ncbi:MAG TPA: SDR family oxidoreductase [Gemmatimonadaceae bacterium]|nr:SDR family oxidoreductase [Gemmatimonadaceae bacterium]
MAILLTGGTGALGRELVRVLRDDAQGELFILTRDPSSAAGVIAQPGVRFIHGDVTHEGFALADSDAAVLRGQVTQLVHCAAATSFTLPLETARAVNVHGTRNVLAFARDCRRVASIACASTVYVAGRRTGIIRESDTSSDGWVNTYEQSKHEMEVVVRDAMTTLPVSLYRFSTIIGHSQTGEVTGFNAIHHALRLFYHGLAPMIPGDLATRIDLVPVDFAARALHHLVIHGFEGGRTYHLSAGTERSCTLDELLADTVSVFEQSRPAWRKRRIERPAVVDVDTYALFTRSVEESGNVVLQRATQAVQAFAWQMAYPKTFDTTGADAALADTGIVAPHVNTYYGKVVRHCVETSWGRGASDGAAA